MLTADGKTFSYTSYGRGCSYVDDDDDDDISSGECITETSSSSESSSSESDSDEYVVIGGSYSGMCYCNDEEKCNTGGSGEWLCNTLVSLSLAG